jgi:5-methylcytosine-specific restriction endonuclease McrA
MHKRGPHNASWKGGNASYWKPKARERDSNTCQGCGITNITYGRSLPVHHIVPLSVGGTHDLDNLVTLCQTCHVRVERSMLEATLKALQWEPEKIDLMIKIMIKRSKEKFSYQKRSCCLVPKVGR